MKKLWFGFILVILISFLILGWAGVRIYQQKPPLPASVVTTDGGVMIPEGAILDGQNVWQAMGGMEMGSVWGHGSYVAPDWTADYIHREAEFILNAWSQEQFQKDYASLPSESAVLLQARLQKLVRTNTYDPVRQRIVLDPIRARAFEALHQRYARIFRDGNPHYAIQKGAIRNENEARQLTAFFFWTSWAASTLRPGSDITYTSNWPHEPLIGNAPTPGTILWTGVSIIALLAGIGIMLWYQASQSEPPSDHRAPVRDPFLALVPTPSQKAVVKYFWVVSLLILVQIAMGILTAHYGVEGGGFYGIPLAKILPYVVTRTWHTQIGLFWIATAWLAAGLYMGPMVCGCEPKGQRLGVNLLFGALLAIVLGSLAGEWMSVEHKLSGQASFYFGHQGYEYVDLGRAWQIGLLAGLVLWVCLVGRCVLIALRKKDEERPLLTLFLIASAAIGLFYSAGLGWGHRSHLATVEYWRWWVVHLWVEGFFEVFATVVIAFFFSRLKLVRIHTANQAVVFSSTIFLTGGIIGTLHHLYFTGTPTAVLALGAVFSALEVVPLVMVGFEAWKNIRLARSNAWVKKYRWPIYFFVAVAFWNFVGAGLFGFMINPPIALYYMQGLNTTPLHGHAALFGVYGMLGIGLMLFCLRILWVREEWKERPICFSFWAMNIGLLAMAILSLLPVGLYQTYASVKYGYWYARSSDFLYSPAMQTLKWMRVLGDSLFAMGAITLVVFIFGLVFGYSLQRLKRMEARENLTCDLI